MHVHACMHVKIKSAEVKGIDAFPVEIEVDVGGGLPGYHLVGLPATSVSEGRVRIRSALSNSGFDLPSRRITVNLAPAEMRKDTAAFDLPIALAVLAGMELLPRESLEGVMALGELSLDGKLRPVRGALPMAIHARESKARCLVVPKENGPEAALVAGLDVRISGHISEVVSFIKNEVSLPAAMMSRTEEHEPLEKDLAEVKGQKAAKRALEVAAAGGHHLLMVGPPGSGKSMLARRLGGLLPPMTFEEALECTKIYSVSGISGKRSLMEHRPFRAPHHTISDAGLVGGGSGPRPGELSLAHNGVLFLDELLEFRRSALEALRQPLEDRYITITRAKSSVVFPADVMLVVALNPCPCGHLGDPRRTCVCSSKQVAAYQSRLSGPLLDRIDIQVEVPAVTYEELDLRPLGESSNEVRTRVEAARNVQIQRFKRLGDNGRRAHTCNAQMTLSQINRYCELNEPGHRLLGRAVDRLGLSARAVHRIQKVARTIADLEAEESIHERHVAEAVGYRALDVIG